MKTWALYGATGYTGPLIAERAVERGLKPVLMGRSEEKLRALAKRLGLEHRAVGLDDAAALREAIRGHACVLHAAGPYLHTSAPMVQACLDEQVSYLDITGEPQVFKDIYARDEEAKAAGVALIPGVGFDVVPSSCLVAHVAAKVPNARTLEFALHAVGKPSAGTVKSAIPIFLGGGRVIRDGAEVPWALGRGSKRVRFSSREVWVAPAPVSDLDAAFHATGIPNITCYFAVPSRIAKLGNVAWPLGVLALPVLRLALGGGRLDGFIERKVKGGTPQSRAAGTSHLWARVEGDGGASAEAWLETPEGYELTGYSAVRAVERLLKTPVSGAVTPSQAFGADFVLEVPRCRRTDRLPFATD